MKGSLAVSLLAVALAVAACGGTATPSPSAAAAGSVAHSLPSGPSAAPTAQPPASQAPAGSGAPAASAAPSPAASAVPVASESPVPSGATTAPASPGPSSSAMAVPCQPTGSNPDFWPGIAQSVTWSVYCAILPAGWTVASGKYRLANGGSLTIVYRGPDDAGVTLSEGAFCTDGSGCVPSGADSGNAPLGTMPGTLVTLDGGGYAVVADRGQNPSWLLTTSGLDQATTISVAAGLALLP